MTQTLFESIQNYYGRVLASKNDLKTTAFKLGWGNVVIDHPECNNWAPSLAGNGCMFPLIIWVPFGKSQQNNKAADRRQKTMKIKIGMRLKFWGVALCLIASGCATRIPPPVSEAGSLTDFSLEKQNAESAFAIVLNTNVDKRGAVNFRAVAAEPAQLNTFLTYIGEYSPQKNPENFASKNERIAYYLNSYNALSLYGVIQTGFPKAFDSFFKRVRFFALKKFFIGGQWISLHAYKNEIIRKEGEPRLHFALNCMSVGCPRLPQEVFEAEKLDAQLEAASREFFNSSKYVQLQPGKKTVALSEILKFYTDDFVNSQQSSSLIEFANRFRNEKIDPSWKVVFIPYDWAVFSQEVR